MCEFWLSSELVEAIVHDPVPSTRGFDLPPDPIEEEEEVTPSLIILLNLVITSCEEIHISTVFPSKCDAEMY